MRYPRLILPATLVMVMILASCKRVPGYVIQPDDMAELMADMRMANAVVTVSNNEYTDEAAKRLLRNAVLDKHRVSEEQFDTSLIWYGHNIAVYQQVTQQSIDILDERLKDLSARAADEAAISVAGDSVNIWGGAPLYVFSRFSPSQYIQFSYDSDPNWEAGDIYTLRARVVTPFKDGRWNITAEYDDGAVETIVQSIGNSEPRRQELLFATDSTRTAVRLSGWIEINLDGHRPVVIDSVEFTRRRKNQALAQGRRYIQRLILPVKDEPTDANSEH